MITTLCLNKKKRMIYMATKKMVTVKDLAIKYGVEGKDIRALLRANGLKAPEVERPAGTFGPKAKYEWEEGSKELKKVTDIIEQAADAEEAEAEDTAEEAEVEVEEPKKAAKKTTVKKAKK